MVRSARAQIGETAVLGTQMLVREEGDRISKLEKA